MTHHFKTLKTVFLLIIISILLNSCNQDIKETTDITRLLLSNNKHLSVEKTNTETTTIGVFSKHNYGTSHNFSYKLAINPKDINWNGGSGEPKNILFYRDTTYIKYLKDKSIRTEYTDSIDNTVKAKYHSEIQCFYEKYIDKRYFFNLSGDDFWTTISSEEYFTAQKLGKEFTVPNDNELSLKPIIIKD